MDRREFVKKLGVGGVLVGIGAMAGLGCSTQGDSPDATAPATDGEQMVAVCPKCTAENEVEEWGVEINCWKCGHTWTPEKPA